MKKFLIFLFLLTITLMYSCKTEHCYVQRSSVAISDMDTNRVWLMESECGCMIYNAWIQGWFGDKTKVYLVDTAQFQQLLKKSKIVKEDQAKPNRLSQNN
jgi:hypothetical protein